MEKLKCENCRHYMKNMYSKNEKKPDSRCSEYHAVLGLGEKGETVSYMTIAEARMPVADARYVERAYGGFYPNPNRCGPEGKFFKNVDR